MTEDDETEAKSLFDKFVSLVKGSSKEPEKDEGVEVDVKTKTRKASNEEDVVKAVDKEQRMAMFVVLEPDVVDAHGDTYNAEEVEKACNSYNQHSMKANLFHKVETEKAKVLQSYISPSTFNVDDGRTVTKGTWLQMWHFPENDEESETIWKMVKSGEINGVSIGARASTEDLQNDKEGS